MQVDIPAVRPPYWLRGAKLRKTYVGFGDALSLSGNLVFLSGLRGKLETIALQFGRLPCLHSPVEESDLLSAWTTIAEALAPRDAFLLYTGWYKETIFVGPVRTSSGRPLFAKLFKKEGDARKDVERARFVEAMAKGFFRTAPVLVESGFLVACELIEHGARPVSHARIEASALAMARASLMRSSQSSAVGGCLDWRKLEASLEKAGFSLSLAPLAGSSRRVQLADCHGDLTPWNVFADRNGNLCLIDYERAETSIPFFDVFHLRIQSSILRGYALQVEETIDYLIKNNAGSWEDIILWYAIYLSRQLQIDSELWNDGKNHPQLSRLIEEKSNLLRKIIQKL